MSLQKELNLINPFSHKSHEAMMSIIVTGVLLSKEGEKILRPFGLTDTQFNILMLKYQTTDGKINQTQLGKMLLVNRSNITGLVDRMEKSGFVRRTADIEDRRVNYVEMTEKGRDIFERTHAIFHKRVDEVMSVLTENDHENLCAHLEAIRGYLKKEHDK